MRAIPVRELNQHTAGVLALVEAGERVEITRNGRRVAIIEPVQPNPLADLVESGELRLATGPLPLVLAGDEPTAADSIGSEAVVDDRDSASRW